MSATVERNPAWPGEAPGESGGPKRGGRATGGGRGRFWLGFALGFALLTIASCSGVALTLGFGRLSLAELRGDGVVWTAPTLIPTPAAALAAEGAAPEVTSGVGRFVAGALARNITGTRVNVRRTPGHLGKPASDVLAQIEPGEQVEILGETTQADNLIWYRVLFAGAEGWVAESTASGVQILGM
ncbi:MAG: SH3 domain-containing protein [Caldilineaceae bacterium]